MFNPITANLENKQIVTDTHAVPEYRSAFFKRMLGKPLTDAETRAFEAAQAEKARRRVQYPVQTAQRLFLPKR
jgi:hypothetical protein